MNCYASGIIGIGMLTSTFFTMSVSEEQNNYLRKNINSNLVDIYNNIIIERRNIYFQGLLLGLILSFFLLKTVKTSNLFHKITFALAIVIPVSVVYYFLMPKSDYMLNHLKSIDENKAWLQVYKTMRYRYFLGFLIGSLSAIPISYSFC